MAQVKRNDGWTVLFISAWSLVLRNRGTWTWASAVSVDCLILPLWTGSGRQSVVLGDIARFRFRFVIIWFVIGDSGVTKMIGTKGCCSCIVTKVENTWCSGGHCRMPTLVAGDSGTVSRNLLWFQMNKDFFSKVGGAGPAKILCLLAVSVLRQQDHQQAHWHAAWVSNLEGAVGPCCSKMVA
jgi:hypothetical protein